MLSHSVIGLSLLESGAWKEYISHSYTKPLFAAPVFQAVWLSTQLPKQTTLIFNQAKTQQEVRQTDSPQGSSSLVAFTWRTPSQNSAVCCCSLLLFINTWIALFLWDLQTEGSREMQILWYCKYTRDGYLHYSNNGCSKCVVHIYSTFSDHVPKIGIFWPAVSIGAAHEFWGSSCLYRGQRG